MRADTAAEPAQLRDFRAELQANPTLYGRALDIPGECTPALEHVLIRTDSKSVELAIARALALAVNGVLCKVELTHDGKTSG